VEEHVEMTLLREGGKERVVCDAEVERGLFGALVRNASGIIAILDVGGRTRYVCETVRRFLGHSPARIADRAGAGLLGLIHPADLPALGKALADVLEEPGKLVRADLRLRHADRSWVWMEASVQNLLGDPAVGGVALNLRDITGRKRAEEAFRRSEERFRSLVQNAQDIICVADAEGRVRYLSPAFERVLGRAPEVSIGRSCFEHVHPEDVGRVRAAFERLLENPSGELAAEARLRHEDGGWRSLEVVGRNLLSNPGVKGMVLNARDITERKAFERQLIHRAFHDALTGLPNRALFTDRLEHALKRTDRREVEVAVLFLDLDGFKLVNDSLGHEVGDELLVAVGRRLRETLRPEDTVARLGGDEFAVLLEDAASLRDARDVAERVLDEIKKPFDLPGQRVFASASVGIALSGYAPNRPADLLRKADLAMYRAKENGRGRYSCFDRSLDVRIRERLGLENDLRRAVERDEFEVYYQPAVRLDSGAVTDVEALLRWRHPEKGLLEPREFLRAAEEMDLMLPIGSRVLWEVCYRAKAWRQRHPAQPPPNVSVNLSEKQLASPGLAQEVGALLRETGLDPATLRLEITESVFMDDPSSNLHTFRALKQLGVQLVLDNFGTGYSSLAYLKWLPIDAVKIDRAFVRSLGEDPEYAHLVSAMVELAHALRKEVAAGGVETADQLSCLRQLGCDVVQGDHLWAPLPAAAADELVAGLATSR
jgi:diguanylate cyclase (GGDEF)-like protein/PAS domain S-box-containing protein